MKNDPLLSVCDLCVSFETEHGRMVAVDGVSFDLNQGDVLGIVGESGCGKTVTALSLLRLVPSPPSNIERGKILLNGSDLLQFSENEMSAVRGNDISIIFQEPMTSLNPVYQVGSQIRESLVLHQNLKRKEAWEKTIELLDMVGISDAAEFAQNYPHQLSGGMRQRVMIAIALACNPKILIADEPTTALDVTIQAQIFELLRGLQEKLKMAVILITHDLGVVAEFVDNVMVMYAGRTIEYGPVDVIFSSPRHPYTQGLLSSIPNINRDVEELFVIPGVVPNANEMPSGCSFHPRCKYVRDACLHQIPSLIELSPEHGAACILAEGEFL